jgi:hypothetical protein
MIKFKKTIELIFSIGVIILLIAPFLYLSKYCHPMYDDYSLYVFQKGKGFFENQLFWYLNWSGRYTAFSLASLIHPLQYGKIGSYGYYAIATILLITFSSFYVVNSFFKNLNKQSKIWIFTSFLFLLTYCLPSTFEFYYWFPSTVSYSLGLILIMWSTFLLISKDLKQSKLSLVLLILLICFIPGTSELITLLFFSNYIIILFFNYLNTQKVARYHFIIIGVLLVFLSVSFFAPGNSIRAMSSIDSGMVKTKLVDTFLYSIIYGIGKIKFWILSSPFILFLVFSACLKGHLDRRITNLINNWLKFSLWSAAHICVFFILIIMVVMNSGIIVPERVLNVLYLYFILFSMITFLLFIELSNLPRLHFVFEYKTLLTIFLLFYTIISPNRISRAILDIRSGTAKQYNQEVLALYSYCEQNQGKELVIPTFKNRPNTIFSNDLNIDANHWENRHFSSYFKLRSIRVDESISSPYCIERIK